MSAAAAPWPAPPRGVPRLLASRAIDLEAHLQRYGTPPQGGPDLVALVEGSGLRGRGGAGFPAGRKLAGSILSAVSMTAIMNTHNSELRQIVFSVLPDQD